jgi:hypothetical protein
MSPTPSARRALPLALLALLLPCAARAAEEPAGPVGEKPTAQTADQAFLRDQALLVSRGRMTLELGLGYQRAERDQLVVRAEQTSATAEVAWRVGLADELQLSARLPWRYQRAAAFGADPATASPAVTRAAFGDLSLGLFAAVLREGARSPNVVLTLDGVVPSGPGESAAGGGVAVTRSYDPVILFCGAGYLYGFRPRPAGQLARHNVGFNAGVAFAMNESVAVTGQVVGSIRNFAAPPGGARPLREQYRLQLGVTLLVTPRLFVEPSVGVGVGTASPDVTFGLNVPWSF